LAIALLRDHDYLIKLDPELASYKEDTPPPGANPKTKFYSITDQYVFQCFNPLNGWAMEIN
jgi:hypothetical protein